MVNVANRINRHKNDFGQSASTIWESATAASDKGSTTIKMNVISECRQVRRTCIDEVKDSRFQRSWCRNRGLVDD